MKLCTIYYKRLCLFLQIFFSPRSFHFLLFCYFISDIDECNGSDPCPGIGAWSLGGRVICKNTFGGHTCYSNTTGVVCDYYGTKGASCYYSRDDKSKWPKKIILLGMLLYSLQMNKLFLVKILTIRGRFKLGRKLQRGMTHCFRL